jgi:ketosteroid isomerase-like protein
VDEEGKVPEPTVEESIIAESMVSESKNEPATASFAEPVIEEPPAAETEISEVAAPTVESTLKIHEPVMEELSPAKSIFLEMPPIKVIATQPPAVAKTWRPPIEIRSLDKIVAVVEEDPKRTGRVRLVATVATLTVVAIAGARYFAGRQGGALPEEQPEAVAASTATPSMSVVAKPVAAMATPSGGPAPPPAAPQYTTSEDPAEVVKQWETALRARDAAGQAAFSADPVERYFLQHDVKKDVVLAEKQAAIDKRKDGWTIKMDRVKVQRKGDDVANVSLVKHYMVKQEGATTSEWFVPSLLQLKRADGKWRIVSERDLGWATSLDDLDG